MTLHTLAEPLCQHNKVFDIASRDKPAALAALALFGITPERVYVDLNMAARRFRDVLDFELELDIALNPR
jgi:hypothetical protein